MYAKGKTLAIARQDAAHTFVALISSEEKKTKVFLPLSILGVREPDAEVDLLGEPLNFERTEEGILLSLSPQDAFLFSCR